MIKFNKKKQTIPEDLGIVIGSKEQALWQRVKEETQGLIEDGENNLAINREILKLANEKTKGLITIDGKKKS